MLTLETLPAIALAFLIVAASPGPANIALATVSLSAGWRSGLLFGAGLGTGLAVWGGVAATGMGAVLQGSASVLMVLKIAGGLYLLWLAYGSARSARRPAKAATPALGGRWFWRGLLLNLSNPKAVVAWMAALAVGLGGDDGAAQVIVATLLCSAIGFANYAAHAALFSRKSAMAFYTRARRWIEGTVAVLFAGAGFGLIRSALSR